MAKTSITHEPTARREKKTRGRPPKPTTCPEKKTRGRPPKATVKEGPAKGARKNPPNVADVLPQGPKFSSVVEQELSVSGTSYRQLPTRQQCGVVFPSTKRSRTTSPTSSFASHMKEFDQVVSQGTSASPIGSIGSDSKGNARNTSMRQKNSTDAHGTVPPLASKKRKASEASSDQSIEGLDDVLASTGVDLMEEENQLFSGSKNNTRDSILSRKTLEEEQNRLILNMIPLKKKLAETMAKCGLTNLSNDVETCLSLSVEKRLRHLIGSLIRVSKERVDTERSRHNTVVTSNVREQISVINRKAREERVKKLAESENVQKQNVADNSPGVDIGVKKGGPAKSLKANNEIAVKLQRKAANVAVHAATGGHDDNDILLKWQNMVQERQKHEVGPGKASSSFSGKGTVRECPRSIGSAAPPEVARSISIKDVISVLERDPEMAKSTLLYRLYLV